MAGWPRLSLKLLLPLVAPFNGKDISGFKVRRIEGKTSADSAG